MSDQVSTTNSKEWKKALSSGVFTEKELMEMAAKPEQDLLDLISHCQVDLKRSQDELLANPAYQKAALAIKDLKSGLKDVTTGPRVSVAIASRILADRKNSTEF